MRVYGLGGAVGKWLSGREHLLRSPEDLNSNHQHPRKAIQTWLKMSVTPSLVGQTHKVPESLGPCLTERSRFQFTEKLCLRQQDREHQKTPPSCPLVSASYNSNIKECKDNQSLITGSKPMSSQCMAGQQQWGAIWFLLQLCLLH